MKKLFLVLLILSTLSTCQQSSEAEQMANDLCDCMQPVAEYFEAIEEMSAEGDVEDMENAMANMHGIVKTSEACMIRLEEKYGDAMEEQEEQIKEIMIEQCPEVVRTMQKTDAGFE